MNNKKVIYKIFAPLVLLSLLFASCSNIMDDLSNATVSYVTDKGGNVDSVKVGLNEKIGERNLPLLKEKGYTHKGWYLGDVKITSSYVVTKNITLTAKWETNTYSIKYNLDGGTNNISNPLSYTVETPSFTLLDPVKEGFIFDGWETSSGEKISKINKGMSGELTLNAKWKIDGGVKYKVYYHLQKEDGENYPLISEVLDTEIREGSGANLSLPSIDELKALYQEPHGFTFSHNDEIKAIKSDGSSVYNLYYTRDRYTISFNANTATGAVPSEIEKLHGVDKVLNVNEGELKKEGFRFDCWNTQADGKGTNYNVNDKITINESITLYAIWTALNTVSSVSFTPKGGEIDKGKVTLSSTTPDVSIYYRTDGKDPTGSSSDLLYDKDKGIQVDSETTIKAIAIKEGMINSVVSSSTYKIKQYEISFKSLHSTHEPIKREKGDVIELPIPSDVTGFSFAGWYLDSKYTEPALDKSFKIIEDDVIYAKWNTLDPVSPVIFSSTVEEIDRGKITLSCATSDALIYYRTDGTNPTGSSSDILYSKENGIDITNDITIKAIATKKGYVSSGVTSQSYKIKQYEIIFDSLHSTHTSLTGAKGDSRNLPIPSIVTGYTFGGWYIDSEYKGDALSGKYEISSSLTLHAKWDANTYTIKFHANGGTAGSVTEMSVKYDSDVTLPSLNESPTKNGLTFAGWAKSETAEVIEEGYEAGSIISKPNFVDGSIGNNTYTLYAVYETPKISIFVNVTGFREVQSVSVGDTPLVPMKEGSKWYKGKFDKEKVLDKNIIVSQNDQNMKLSTDEQLYNRHRYLSSCNVSTVSDLIKTNESTTKLFIDTSTSHVIEEETGEGNVWYFRNKEYETKGIYYEKFIFFDGISWGNRTEKIDENGNIKVLSDAKFNINAYDENGHDLQITFDSANQAYINKDENNTYSFTLQGGNNLLDKIGVTASDNKGNKMDFNIQVLYPVTFNMVNARVSSSSAHLGINKTNYSNYLEQTKEPNIRAATVELTASELNGNFTYSIWFARYDIRHNEITHYLVNDISGDPTNEDNQFIQINLKDFLQDITVNKNIYFDFSDSNMKAGTRKRNSLGVNLINGPSISKPAKANVVKLQYSLKNDSDPDDYTELSIHNGGELNLTNYIPHKNYYVFVHWCEDETCLQKANDKVTINQDTTYYAYWEKRYEISQLPKETENNPITNLPYDYNWITDDTKSYILVSGGTDGEHWIECENDKVNNKLYYHTNLDFTEIIVARFNSDQDPNQVGINGANKKSGKLFCESRYAPGVSTSYFDDNDFYIKGGMAKEGEKMLKDPYGFQYYFTYDSDTMIDKETGSSFDSDTRKGTVGFKITKGEGDDDVRFGSSTTDTTVAVGNSVSSTGNNYVQITGLEHGKTYVIDIDYINENKLFKVRVSERTKAK